MIEKIFDRIGGEKALMSYMEKRHPNMYREPGGSMREQSNEASSTHSMRQSSVIGGKSSKSKKPPIKADGPKGLHITSHVTNMKRSPLTSNGKIQPFD